VAFGYLFWEIFRLPWLYRDRMLAAMVLIFFNMLFFSFFEQAGNSLNVFTDRNVSRVESVAKVTPDMVGTTIRLQPTQAQLGYSYGDGTFTIDDLDKLRKTIQQLPEFTNFQIDWPVDESHVGMTIAERKEELPASIFQALNAVFILVFALVFNWIWSSLDRFGWNPPAAVKFGLGLIQLGLGFYALVIGASSSSEQGLISIWWLVLAYYLHTTGELCLSPVGLSAMTKLSAKHLVSTLMGAWFLATAFSQYLAGIISQMAGVKDDMLSEGFPTPKETLELSTGVFSQVGAVAVMSGVLCAIGDHHVLDARGRYRRVGDELRLARPVTVCGRAVSRQRELRAQGRTSQARTGFFFEITLKGLARWHLIWQRFKLHFVSRASMVGCCMIFEV
jgi:dipeptide/tripeptide permease